MKYLCIRLIRFYQRCISPLKGGPCCRFTPTCSAYAIEAFSEWGFFAGLGLTIWRILRCNPFCRGGYDPVPINKKRRDRENKTGSETPRREFSDTDNDTDNDTDTK